MTDALDFSVLIPARLGSTRLPEKALADLNGKPMVVRVAEQAAQSGARIVAVATDDERIQAAVSAAGLTCVMTDPGHPSGTDRLAEAAQHLGLDPAHIVVNLQGDEPLMPPSICREVAQCLATSDAAAMATAVCPIDTDRDWQDPNAVKAVLDANQRALYFSRAAVPYHRADPDHRPAGQCWHHVGIYAYRVSFLQKFVGLSPSPIEQAESLEQLRALWHGYVIQAVGLPHPPPPGVDTPADLARVRAELAASG